MRFIFYEIKNIIVGFFKKFINNKYIAPLSPGFPNDYDEKEYAIYNMYLKKAFSDNKIKNIAITGDFGIGKSSFIKNGVKEKNIYSYPCVRLMMKKTKILNVI